VICSAGARDSRPFEASREVSLYMETRSSDSECAVSSVSCQMSARCDRHSVCRSVQMKGVRAEGEVYRVLERCLGARDRLESRIRSIA